MEAPKWMDEAKESSSKDTWQSTGGFRSTNMTRISATATKKVTVRRRRDWMERIQQFTYLPSACNNQLLIFPWPESTKSKPHRIGGSYATKVWFDETTNTQPCVEGLLLPPPPPMLVPVVRLLPTT